MSGPSEAARSENAARGIPSEQIDAGARALHLSRTKIDCGLDVCLYCQEHARVVLGAARATEPALGIEEIERLRRGLEAVQEIPCGVPGHAVAVGCQRALAAQAVLGGWEPTLWRGSVPPEAHEYARRFVDEVNAARREVDG